MNHFKVEDFLFYHARFPRYPTYKINLGTLWSTWKHRAQLLTRRSEKNLRMVPRVSEQTILEMPKERHQLGVDPEGTRKEEESNWLQMTAN